MIHLVLFVCLLHFVSSQTEPFIVDSSPLLIKDVNETAEMFCKVKNLGHSTINWSREKAGKLSNLAINGLKGVVDERIQVKFDNTSPTASSILYFARLQPQDAAVYRCSVSLSGDRESVKEVTLQVRSPPFFLGNSTDRVDTPLNNTISLECFGGGYPAPTVTWTREGNAPLPNGSLSLQHNILKIPNVKKEDAGTYLCTMNNNVSSVKKNFQVIVQYPPVVKPRVAKVGQAIGHDAYLECQIESDVGVNISWFKGAETISENQIYTISQSAIDGPNRTTALKIQIDGKQYGIYTCEARNPFGKTTAEFELYKTDKEVCVRNCDVSSGHSIISVLDLKLSFTSVIILMFHWQNM